MAPMNRTTYIEKCALDTPVPISASNQSALNDAFKHKSGLVRTLLVLSVLVPLFCLALITAPIYALTFIFYGRPPITPTVSNLFRYTVLVFSYPHVRPYSRMMILYVILRKLLLIPIFGVGWHLDEMLYGGELDKQEIISPVFLISGARSGSTTTGHLLDNDPQFVSPAGVMTLFPFLWLWKTISYFSRLGLLPSPESFSAAVIAKVSKDAPEFVARHEFDPLKPDTFEVPWLVNRGFFQIGPEFGADEMIKAVPVSDKNIDVEMWDDFVSYTDRIMRKVLCFNCKRSGKNRIMIKGHFLAVAKTLEAKYPNSRFITVVRDPAKRLESLLNFMIANRLLIVETPLIPTIRDVLAIGEAITRLELDYMREEENFFASGGRRKTCIQFAEYVANTKLAVAKCYAVINEDGQVPKEILSAIERGREEHKNRSKMKYRIKLSLGEFGIDEEKFKKLCKK